MRILLVGSAGMLAHDLGPALVGAGHQVRGVDRPEIDITDAAACEDAVPGHDLVVNAAAWTAVDDAETHEGPAFAVNAVGAANLARACARSGARLAQISTDYVFDGAATQPYRVDAPLAPRSAYGRTKAAGEWAVRALCPHSWVVRTAWLYGAGGPNFVRTMATLATQREHLDVVDDQRGQPTWTADLSRAVLALVAREAPYGVYHATGSGETTWFGLTQAIFVELGLDPARVRPTTTAAFPRPAPRPAYSVLDHSCWAEVGLSPLPQWRESLARALPAVVAGR